jgi:hypothetical protein
MAQNTDSRKVLVIHGPNLNMLGKREPDIYGHQTLEEINAALKAQADRLGLHIETFQSNHEGDIVDKIQQAHDSFHGIIINRHPGCPFSAQYTGCRDTPFQHLQKRILSPYIDDLRCRHGPDFRIRVPWVYVSFRRAGSSAVTYDFLIDR